MEHFIFDLEYAAMGLNTLLYTFFTKKSANSPSLRRFRWYMWCIVVVQIIATYYAKHNWINLHLTHYYFNLQFITVSLLYRHLFRKKIVKQVITYLIYLIPAFLTIRYLTDKDIYKNIYNVEVFLCSVPLIAYAVMYLYRSIEIMNKKWIYFSAGIMLYLLSSSIVFSGYDILMKEYFFKGKEYYSFWFLNSIVYLLYQLLVILEWIENFRGVNWHFRK
ncbi:hypothetical protein NBRC110019_21640 [Neptunitalea chrysea]|uniref:Uncharacterized protein n=1 Tax=Neptunitalea chrysea TaxID=1647581 RepID=A0A9W6B5Q9_9FLAO|nr:hypothetical protein [Neptunitalea chrysea]GLB53124.1 hypothetical protein NBRC110019_21640 [Neptunitalea chrysea]